MSNLENAIILACKKHRGQIDCHGQPYILHLLRVMLQMSSPEQQIIAILQDTLAHSNITVVDLISIGFSNEVIDALLLLHQQKHESFMNVADAVPHATLAATMKSTEVIDHLTQQSCL